MSNTEPTRPVVDVIGSEASALDPLVAAVERCEMQARVFTSTRERRQANPAPGASCVLVQLNGSSKADEQSIADSMRLLIDAPSVVVLGDGADAAAAATRAEFASITLLERPARPEQLEDAIRHAAATHRRRSAVRRRFAELAAQFEQLTDREKAIMEGVTAGRLNKGVAIDLKMSIRTVENDRAKILTKLGANSSAAAIAKYVEYRTLAGLGYRVESAAAIHPPHTPHENGAARVERSADGDPSLAGGV